jgi:hypothetical protein
MSVLVLFINYLDRLWGIELPTDANVQDIYIELDKLYGISQINLKYNNIYLDPLIAIYDTSILNEDILDATCN